MTFSVPGIYDKGLNVALVVWDATSKLTPRQAGTSSEYMVSYGMIWRFPKNDDAPKSSILDWDFNMK